MDFLTGNIDTDREILYGLPVKDVLRACSANSYAQNQVCDDGFWFELIRRDYGLTITRYQNYRQLYFDLARDKDETPFVNAVATGHTRVVSLFLTRGGLADGDIDKAYIQAAANGYIDIIELLESLLKNKRNTMNKAGIEAAKTCQIDVFDHLKAQGYPQNHELYYLTTCLPIVKLFVKDSYYATQRLLYAQSIEEAEWLLTFQPDIHVHEEEALFSAASKGRAEIVDLLLDAGADPNPERGFPLRFAVKNRHLKIAERLLEQGADPNVDDEHSSLGRPLYLAIANGDLEMVELLHRYGAKIGPYDLHASVSRDKFDIAKWLVRHGASYKDDDYHTLEGDIEKAIRVGDLELFVLLVSLSDEPVVERRFNLRYAINLNKADIVRWLIEQGVSPLGVEIDEETSPEIVKIIESYNTAYCQGTTKLGNQCRLKAKRGTKYCGIHCKK